MKKIVLAVLICLFLATGVSADSLLVGVREREATLFTASTLNTAQVGTAVSLGGVFSKGTCQVSGTAGTMNLDIDGSLDGTTYYGIVDDITALSIFSWVDQPTKSILGDIDTCSGGCTLTVRCVLGGN